MSSPSGPSNKSARQQRQDDFYAAMPNEMKFVRDALTAVEPIITDKTLGPKQRCLADWKRQAWGNYSLYCINDEDGTTYTQADTARKLRLSESTVSRAASYYEGRGYIRTDGQRIIPVIHPQLKEPPDNLAEYARFEVFIQDFRLADSATFDAWTAAKAALELAKSATKPLEKVVLSAYRDWRRAQESAGIPYKTLRTTKEPDIEASSSADASSEEATTTPFDPLSDQTPPAAAAVALEAGIMRMFVQAGKDNPTVRQLAEVIALLPDHPDAGEAFLENLAGKIRRINHPGALRSIVEGFNRGWAEVLAGIEIRREAVREQEAKLERWRREAEENGPDHIVEITEMAEAPEPVRAVTPDREQREAMRRETSADMARLTAEIEEKIARKQAKTEALMKGQGKAESA